MTCPQIFPFGYRLVQRGLRHGALSVQFVDIYHRLGRDYKVPILLVKDLVRCNPVQYSEPLTIRRYDSVVADARKDRVPIFDILIETPWHRVSDAKSTYREIFRSRTNLNNYAGT